MDALDPIRAAGGVVWRPGGTGSTSREVIMVHRPRYDDWTLPKGKLEPGELALVAAVREVWEETAIRAVAGVRLPTVYYDAWAKPGRGRTGATDTGTLVEKLVDYWAMRVGTDDGFVPGRETDQRVWLSVDEALARLSYPHDAKVLTAFSELPAACPPVVLLRHSSAGDRKSFAGPDLERPLDPMGLRRADDLVDPLRCFGPARLIAAPARRCGETLRPLSDALHLPVEVEPAFGEDADVDSATRLLRQLGGGGVPVVVCSQGKLIPPVLAALTGQQRSLYRTTKGGGWVLSFAVKSPTTGRGARGRLTVVDQLAA